MAKKKTRPSDRPQDLKPDSVAPTTHPYCDAPGRMADDNLIRFMPCAFNPFAGADSGTWVKYKNSKDHTHGVKVIHETFRELILEFPDRIMYFGRDQLMPNSPRPLDLDWDVYIPMTLTHEAGNDSWFDRFMVNPHAMTRREAGYNMRLNERGAVGTSDLVMVADSGGFQLRKGTLDFIDPYSTINFYNSNMDEGMPLDIPCGSINDAEVIEACARVQLKNSKLFRKNKRPSLRLSTIIHGNHKPQLEAYKRIIDEDPEWDMCSLPSSASLPSLQQIDRLAYLLCHGYQYSQYHQLGLYTVSSTIVTAYLAQRMLKAGRKVLFTADATTGLVSANNRCILTTTGHHRPIERILLGQSSPGNIRNADKMLPCGCPICRHTMYIDAMVSSSNASSRYLLNRHNDFLFARWCRMINNYARDLEPQDFKELAMSISSRQYVGSMVDALKYVDILLEDGYAEAHKRFAHKLDTMFSVDGSLISDEFGNPIPREDNISTLTKRLGKVAKTYSDWYGDGRPSKLKKKAVTRTKKWANQNT